MSNDICPTCGRGHDLVRVCKDCQATFSISLDEQIRFQRLQFDLPKRCGNCRAVRRQRANP